MRRPVKVKSLATRVPLRKAGKGLVAGTRRPFPAWIADDDPGMAFPTKAAVSRVRDSLVLRTVSKKKSAKKSKSSHDAPGAR